MATYFPQCFFLPVATQLPFAWAVAKLPDAAAKLPRHQPTQAQNNVPGKGNADGSASLHCHAVDQAAECLLPMQALWKQNETCLMTCRGCAAQIC